MSIHLELEEIERQLLGREIEPACEMIAGRGLANQLPNDTATLFRERRVVRAQRVLRSARWQRQPTGPTKLTEDVLSAEDDAGPVAQKLVGTRARRRGNRTGNRKDIPPLIGSMLCRDQ